MVKIDFSKLPCYVDIKRAARMEQDVKYDFANSMYLNGRGVAYGALAMKIYNSDGEEQYDERETELILDFVRNFPPIFYDSLKEYIDSNKQ